MCPVSYQCVHCFNLLGNSLLPSRFMQSVISDIIKVL